MSQPITLQTETQEQKELAENIPVYLGQIHQVIEDIGEKIQKTCQDQEDKFLDQYRRQMYEAQKNMREYTQNNNEEILKKKYEEKELELKVERERNLQETLKTSNKIKAMKKQYTDLLTQSDDLQEEIKFIDEQSILADEKNKRLREELENLKLEILKNRPDFEFWDDEGFDQGERDSSPIKNNMANSNSLGSPAEFEKMMASPKIMDMKKNASMSKYNTNNNTTAIDERYYNALKEKYNQELKNYEILKKINENPAFEKTKFEEIFEEAIKRTLDRDAVRASKLKLPKINNSKYIASYASQEENSHLDTNLEIKALDNLKLTEIQFTEFDKKIMFELFLENPEVKNHLYQKLTEDKDKNKKKKAL